MNKDILRKKIEKLESILKVHNTDTEEKIRLDAYQAKLELMTDEELDAELNKFEDDMPKNDIEWCKFLNCTLENLPTEMEKFVKKWV